MRKVNFNDLNIQYRNIKLEIDQSISQIINESQFINGPNILEFEKNFSQLIDSKYSISCGNGTDALYIAMKSLGLKNGDEVITTSHSWIATSEAISQTGAIPVFIDTEENSFCIDPNLIEEKITDKTVGIVPVHLYGNPCDMNKICAIAENTIYGLLKIVRKLIWPNSIIKK